MQGTRRDRREDDAGVFREAPIVILQNNIMALSGPARPGSTA